jgi:hypothetical protein
MSFLPALAKEDGLATVPVKLDLVRGNKNGWADFLPRFG